MVIGTNTDTFQFQVNHIISSFTSEAGANK